MARIELARLSAADFKSATATYYVTVAYYLVGKERLELSRLAALASKTSMATNYITHPFATRNPRILSAA